MINVYFNDQCFLQWGWLRVATNFLTASLVVCAIWFTNMDVSRELVDPCDGGGESASRLIHAWPSQEGSLGWRLKTKSRSEVAFLEINGDLIGGGGGNVTENYNWRSIFNGPQRNRFRLLCARVDTVCTSITNEAEESKLIFDSSRLKGLIVGSCVFQLSEYVTSPHD